ELGEDYVAATRVMGARTPWILVKHVARNSIAPILTFATVLVADAIVFEASLSFINAGVRPPDPSWGNIMSEGKQLLLSGRWWPTFFPGVMLLLTTLTLNVLSEGMTDSLATPKARTNVDVEADELRVAESDAEAEARVREVDPAEVGEGRAGRLPAPRRSGRSRDERLADRGDAAPLREVRNLSCPFPAAHGEVKIVGDVSFSVRSG